MNLGGCYWSEHLFATDPGDSTIIHKLRVFSGDKLERILKLTSYLRIFQYCGMLLH